MRTRFLPAVLTALLLVAACGEPTAPKPLGRFVLTSLGGQPEPFVWLDHTFSSGERRVFSILADTLWLLADGRVRRSDAHMSESFPPDGGPSLVNVSASSTGGSYRREGDRVIVERVVLSALPEGTMQVDTMLFRDGALEQTKRLGIVCSPEPCPPPRDFLLRYERR